jgi:hypothetical protein
MDKLQETAIQHLEIITLFLDSDPEIIGSLPSEDVGEELSELGIPPDLPINIIKNVTDIKSKHSGDVSDVEQRIRALFQSAKEDIFEDGIENNFLQGLTSLLNEYGDDAIAALSHHILHASPNEETVSEALRWLGRLSHPTSHDMRLMLLEGCLSENSARVRDAASVGLATLNDPHAIPYLKQAIEREEYAELREDMEQVLDQLEGTR